MPIGPRKVSDESEMLYLLLEQRCDGGHISIDGILDLMIDMSLDTKSPVAVSMTELIDCGWVSLADDGGYLLHGFVNDNLKETNED